MVFDSALPNQREWRVVSAHGADRVVSGFAERSRRALVEICLRQIFFYLFSRSESEDTSVDKSGDKSRDESGGISETKFEVTSGVEVRGCERLIIGKSILFDSSGVVDLLYRPAAFFIAEHADRAVRDVYRNTTNRQLGRDAEDDIRGREYDSTVCDDRDTVEVGIGFNSV